MTAAGPVRDSVLDALGYAIRVIAKPSYWWAPALLTAIGLLPVFALGPMPGTPGGGAFGAGGFGARPFETQAEIEAYFRNFVPVFVGSLILALVLAPFAAAAMYRVAIQYVNGERARPFGPGFFDLAWRYFLQTLALAGLLLGGCVVAIIAFAILVAIFGFGLAMLVIILAFVVAGFGLILRLAIAPALLASCAGPIESMVIAWRLTRGHGMRVFRWWMVTVVIVGIASSAFSAVFNLVFGAVGLAILGSVLAVAVTGPLTVAEAIVLVLLARLLSRPIEAPPPPDLPAWMKAPSPPGAA